MKLLAFALVAFAQIASAQSTGSMTSPQTGSASAGGGPVGVLLPSSIQSSSTAPTQPGHTITGDRPSQLQRSSAALSIPREDSARLSRTEGAEAKK